MDDHETTHQVRDSAGSNRVDRRTAGRDGGVASAVPPPTSVSSGAATVSGVNVNGSGNNYALVSATAHVTVAGNYAVNDSGCPLCNDQIEIGWAGSSAPLACIYADGPIGSGSFSGQDLGPHPTQA